VKGYARLSIPLIWYGIFCFVMFQIDTPSLWLYYMMAWNVFLAAVPMLFILKSEKMFREKRIWPAIILGAVWLIFFPNSVYMPTDMIHIAGETFRLSSEPYAPVQYTEDIVLWLRLIIIACGILLSMIMGLESLRIAKRQFPIKWQWPFAACASLLAGLGVYIGRFLRFNSWDILRPIRLMRNVLESLDGFALRFSVCYGIFVLLVFIFYELMLSCGSSDKCAKH